MTAIITDTLTAKIAQDFLEEINSNAPDNQYYIGLGKSDIYNELDVVEDPIKTKEEERYARSNLQSIKKVEAASFVVRRYNWTSGSVYSAYSDASIGIPQNSYYVLTEENEVYICLQQGRNANGLPNPSTVAPSFSDVGAQSNKAFKTADGYVWKFLFALSATQTTRFLSASFHPVTRVEWNAPGDSAFLSAFELQQLDVQRSATPGQVLSGQVVSGGSGYSSQPTVTVFGNGTGAEAVATIANGSIVKVEMLNESAGMGEGYDIATMEVTGGGGTGAIIRPILSPKYGIGVDPKQDLKASSVMMNIKPDGSVDGTFVVDNDFRQITLFRNITYTDSDGIFAETSSNALKQLQLTQNVEEDFTIDNFIRGQTSGAGAFIDKLDSDLIYYHQNENTGFKQFIDGEEIQESDGSGFGNIIDADLKPVIDPFSGELLYIENRARILRNEAQQEDIKIIITV